jgi:hypothetical protein
MQTPREGPLHGAAAGNEVLPLFPGQLVPHRALLQRLERLEESRIVPAARQFYPRSLRLAQADRGAETIETLPEDDSGEVGCGDRSTFSENKLVELLPGDPNRRFRLFFGRQEFFECQDVGAGSQNENQRNKRRPSTRRRHCGCTCRDMMGRTQVGWFRTLPVKRL